MEPEVAAQPAPLAPSDRGPTPSRRAFLQAGVVGGAAIAVGGMWIRPALAAGVVFVHGVASGDPTANAVIIWTRVTADSSAVPGSGLGADTDVFWEVASDDAFGTVVASGHVTATAASDHTVKVDVTSLSPYTRYYYRFTALGETSPVGRTSTAGDDGSLHALRLALVSCSNYTGGYFTPYRYIAQRDDLDFVLHVGDYIYEYGNAVAPAGDRYGPSSLIGARDTAPATDPVSLNDYRVRYGAYRQDADLQEVHRRQAWIAIFDDHEVCNNTWADGAEHHDPTTQGPFAVRKANAYQAYQEWIPIRLPDQSVPHQGTRFFRRFTYGPLADLSVLETRQNRDEQVIPTGTGFTAYNDPRLALTRQLPEPEQKQWLKDGLADATRPWHLVGNQVQFSPVYYPAALLGVTSTPFLQNTDQWDGYVTERNDLLAHMTANGKGDAVFLTGDIHSSWANEVPATSSPGQTVYTPVCVEFICPSITSDGFEELAEASGYPAAAQAGNTVVVPALEAANPWSKSIEGVHHGFTVIDVTPARVQADWQYVSDRTDPNANLVTGASLQTLAGSKRVTAATPLGARADSPADASAPPAALPEGPLGLAVGVAALGFIAARVRKLGRASEGDLPTVH